MDTRQPLSLPDGAQRLLLHSCCAPCSGELIEALLASDIEFEIFFYNPNIHPEQEYTIRKEEKYTLLLSNITSLLSMPIIIPKHGLLVQKV